MAYNSIFATKIKYHIPLNMFMMGWYYGLETFWNSQKKIDNNNNYQPQPVLAGNAT